ncbi:MAG: hypothetical protein BWY93_00998 [Euryarchaeota archaeon ADurb.BinA087]|nr:MAG: hypothetical protein BWY93_00998 [Euryarchaeota archaeon ADurb.BinA087]
MQELDSCGKDHGRDDTRQSPMQVSVYHAGEESSKDRCNTAGNCRVSAQEEAMDPPDQPDSHANVGACNETCHNRGEIPDVTDSAVLPWDPDIGTEY